jgi:uncharacterized protein (DUF1501 family)
MPRTLRVPTATDWNTRVKKNARVDFVSDESRWLCGMGLAWRETVVALTTEFGRPANVNGTEGTDHGTGTVTLPVGGVLEGGRVIADGRVKAD